MIFAIFTENTNSTCSQDRAKVISRRRPQSRKARRLAATKSGMDFDDPGTPTTPSTPTIPEIPNLPDLSSDSPAKSPADNGDGEKKSDDIPRTDDPLDGPPPLRDTAPEDDLFSKDFKSKSKTSDALASDNDDLFGSMPPSKSKSKSPEKKSEADKKASAAISDDLDDIFSKAPTKTKSDAVSKVLDDDDLFAPPPQRSTEKKSKAKAVDDDDDLFAVKSSDKKDGSKPAVDDDDDIFGDSSVKKSKGKTFASFKNMYDQV